MCACVCTSLHKNKIEVVLVCSYMNRANTALCKRKKECVYLWTRHYPSLLSLMKHIGRRSGCFGCHSKPGGLKIRYHHHLAGRFLMFYQNLNNKRCWNTGA